VNVVSHNQAVITRRLAPLLQAAMMVTLCVAFYVSMVPPLVKEWYEHENFSYGFLIPFIFLYLLWEEREAFRDPLIGPSPWGALSFLGALSIGLLGKALGEPFVVRIAFVLTVASLVHVFWGWHCVKRLAFPLAYLFFMVPPPYVIVKEVSYYLKMSDAYIANVLAQAVGVPVYRDAYFLHLPSITLEVADVCSGIASLFAMLALGTIYVYYLPTRISMKFVVLIGAVFFPIMANLFRIFLVTVSVYYYGPIMLQAFFHHFTGTFTFLLSLLMFLSLGEIVRWKYPKAPLSIRHQEAETKVTSPADKIAGGQAQTRGLALPVLGVVLVVGLVLYLLDSPALSRGQKFQIELAKISSAVGSYRVGSVIQSDSYADPRAEKTLSRLYESPKEEQIELFVGYSGRQFDENRLQSPKLVFPKGWEYASMEEMTIPIAGRRPFDAVGLVTKKSDAKKFVLFWYEVRGQSFASDFRNRIELIKGLALHGRTDGAVIRLATPIGEFESVEKAKDRLVSFAMGLYPEIAQVLPR
jgi:EpsI family protein